jgi:hypothetical protein
LIVATSALLVTSCNLPQPQVDLVRHFTLSSPAATTPRSDGTIVRPVQVAGHLRSRSMAIRVSENEVAYNDEARWAESLDDAITQLLRARLGAIGGHHVVTVQVQRCEVVQSAGGAVQLAANYTIAPALGTKGELIAGNFVASPRVWDGKDVGVLVGLLREAIGELGNELAKKIEER